jgi:endopolyphosphatase
MNVDHFFFIDVDELEATTASSKLWASSSSNDDDEESTASVNEESRSRYKKNRIHTMGRVGDTALAQELYKDFSDMPDPSSSPGKGKPGKGKPGKGKKGKKGEKIKMEDYTVVNVAASLIPTYLPGIRVYK